MSMTVATSSRFDVFHLSEQLAPSIVIFPSTLTRARVRNAFQQ